MFILNAYKRKGIGKIVANILLDMYKGNWEVRPVPRSESAKIFWERIIKEYTNDNYQTKYPKPNRTTFVFNNENCTI